MTVTQKIKNVSNNFNEKDKLSVLKSWYHELKLIIEEYEEFILN